ncbi:hypothetical protein AVEN_6779-1 [Araneus ventricosus]|uniref:CCHC-type domain-containing protein n=1 Tax=Araneus ventricosus TaxID=182803 RepID=A0A4Y2LZ57_ARAVE|nr:hypothetical protein AVEN_6779-1 [Araneus ventricosus]
MDSKLSPRVGRAWGPIGRVVHVGPWRINRPVFQPLVQRISQNKETFHTVSPFLVEKAISGSLGEIRSIRKLRSGDLLIEVKSRKQSQQILKLKALGAIPVSVTAHTSLNTFKSVIICGELLDETVEKITEELNSEGVFHVRRIYIRRDGQLLHTKRLILTFHKPKLPESIRAGYIKLAVRPYIPNPLRCFQCQHFGHAKGACRGTIACARCAEIGHDSQQCTAQEKCVNCSGSHTSYSRSCLQWQVEKQIVTVKFIENLSYLKASCKVTAQTPIPGVSYAFALTDTTAKTANKIQTSENSSETDTILSEPTPTKQSKPRKSKRKPKSQSSLTLKLSKRGLPQKELPLKLKKSLLQSSVALGLANQGNVHKDLTSLFGGAPKSPDRLSLRLSEEEDEHFEMSCDISSTPTVFRNSLPTPFS